MAIRQQENVTLDGREFVLKYDLNALALLEDRLGIGIHKILAEFKDIPQMKFLKLSLWAGVQHSKSGKVLTPERIGETLAAEMIEPYLTAVLREIVRSLGQTPSALEADVEVPPPLDEPQPGTGTA